jgi:predicted RNA-binding protein associated with RNAse of E/G family
MTDQVPDYSANLKKFTDDELEKALESGSLTPAQMREVRRILRARYAASDRNIQLWILAVAIGTLIATKLTWLMI